MAMVLPKHLTAERMARVACTAILKTPKLAACSTESLLQALMLCSQAGLEPDGRNAHLIPYGDQVQVIFDWKGLVALARRNGVQNIAADVVCSNDTFEWFRDADGLHFKHQIDFRKPRGEMFAAFCIWKDGDQFDGEVMTKDEVDGIRKRSRAGTSGPWVTDYSEMAKKTVVRRASKKWPLDAELAEALNDADSNALPTVHVSSNKPDFSPALLPAPQDDDVPMGDDKPAEAPKPRGRPPGSVNKPSVEQPKANPEPTKTNYLKGVRGLLVLSGIEESDYVAYLHGKGMDDSLTTLEEIAMVAGANLATDYANWPEVEKAIKGDK